MSDSTDMRDLLIAQMKSIFGSDENRINHALRVLSYAEQILRAEGGDTLVVQAAAILHDIGIVQAQRKHGSSAERYQEIEGPPIAEEILQDLDFDPQSIDHVCRIIANHHSARDIDTLEFRIIWDADWIVNIPEEWPSKTPQQIHDSIEKTFRTSTGRALALAEHCS